MSVSSTVSRIQVTISALPQTIPIFEFNSEDDLLVLDGGASNTANDPAWELVLNSDYTVTGGGYNAQNQLQTGNVIVKSGGANDVQVGDVITILRNISPLQDTSFASTGLQTPIMIEQDDDKLTTLTQQLLQTLPLNMRAPSNEDVDFVLPGADARASAFPYFDSSGDLTVYTLADLIAAVGSGGGGAPVAANLFYAGPSSGSPSTPSFRAITANDISGLTGFALAGPITTSNLTQTTGKLLGRTTGSTGAIEEITPGTSLSFSAGALDTIQPILTTSTPTFKGLTLTRTDGIQQLTLTSASRSYGLAVSGTNFLLDDLTASANRLALDSSGTFYVVSLSSGGIVTAAGGTGGLGLATGINSLPVGNVTPDSGVFTTLRAANFAVGTAALTSSGIINAASITGSGVGLYNQETHTASANTQAFVGIQSGPTYAKGGFTGLDAKNIRIGTPTASGAGTIATAYQLFIDAGVSATASYGIYQDGTDLNLLKGLLSIASSTPASAAASGTQGTITWDSSFIYIATGTNTWKRVAIATW